MQKFTLDHIKSFMHSEEIEIKPITVLVGKNSCGKSSLLRFPAVLAQTFREEALTPLLLFGSLIDYGNYEDVAYRHGDSPLGFRLAFGPELMDAARVRYHTFSDIHDMGLVKVKSIEVQVHICKPEKRLQVQEIELYIEGKKLCSLNRKKNGYVFGLYQIVVEETWKNCEINITLPDISFYKFLPQIRGDKFLTQYVSEKNVLIGNAPDYSEYRYLYSPLQYIEDHVCEEEKQNTKMFYRTILNIQTYFQAMRNYLRSQAERTAYIGPFRETPKRIYRDSESSFIDVGVNGENVSMILRQAAQSDRKLLEAVSEWLQKTMGYTLDIKDVGNGIYSLVVCRDEESDNIIDVGFGISQVLPIVTQLFVNSELRQTVYGPYMLKRRTVIFEQPEIHLHPAAQAQLADLFVDCVCNKKGVVNRILIETHSEHLIRKLQVLAADPDIPINHDQIAIYYVDKDEKGDSYVEKMEMDEKGQFEKAWPKGFFDKSYELTKMLMRANSKISGRER